MADLHKATRKLELIAALQSQITSQAPTQSLTPMSTEAKKETAWKDECQAKFHRGWSKGSAEDPKRRGKGNQQSQRSSKWAFVQAIFGDSIRLPHNCTI